MYVFPTNSPPLIFSDNGKRENCKNTVMSPTHTSVMFSTVALVVLVQSSWMLKLHFFWQYITSISHTYFISFFSHPYFKPQIISINPIIWKTQRKTWIKSRVVEFRSIPNYFRCLCVPLTEKKLGEFPSELLQ